MRADVVLRVGSRSSVPEALGDGATGLEPCGQGGEGEVGGGMTTALTCGTGQSPSVGLTGFEPATP